MRKTLHVMLSVDDSAASFLAAQWVARMPRRGWPMDCTLLAVEDPYASQEKAARVARGALAQASALLHESSMRYTTLQLSGNPAEVISAQASALGVDAIVMGRTPKSAVTAALLGSVTAEVLSLSSVPVIIVSHPLPQNESTLDSPLRHPTVMLAVDGSTHSGRVAGFAAKVAEAAGARLHSVHVRPAMSLIETLSAPTEVLTEHWSAAEAKHILADARAVLHAHDVEVTEHLIDHNDPIATLTNTAQWLEADLIVMGCKGHSPLEDLKLGSVSQGLVRRANCAVALIK